MNQLLKKISLSCAIATLGVAAIPPQGAWARNPFARCIGELTRTGISSQNAGVACSDAIIPKELSRCVVTVRKHTTLESEKILEACYRVRRPIDLANCVVDINASVPHPQATETPDNQIAEKALDTCRRSLLPGRHSQCVIAISRDKANTTPGEAMDTCLAAEDFPRDLFPNYVDN